MIVKNDNRKIPNSNKDKVQEKKNNKNKKKIAFLFFQPLSFLNRIKKGGIAFILLL